MGQFLKPVPVDVSILDESGQVDGTEAAGFVGKKGLFAAGIGRLDLPDMWRRICPVDRINKNDPRIP